MEVSNSDNKSKWQPIRHGMCIVVLVIFVFACYGIALALHRKTIVTAWIPACMSFIIAALLSIKLYPIWRLVTQSTGFVKNYLCSLVVMTGLIVALFYGSNFIWSDPSSQHVEQATVERRYSETHYRTKRVNRRYVKQGEPYNVYYIEIAFSNGKHKTQPVTLKQFNHIRVGNKIPLYMEKGLFSFPVIKKVSFNNIEKRTSNITIY